MSSNYLFSQVPKCNIQRSVFPRNHNYKTTIQGDYLYPCYVDEIYPGDSVKISVNLFARMATQIVPLMDNCYIDVFAFFVPRRLVWEHWQNFMGEKVNPSDTTEYLVPKVLSKISATGTDTGFASLSLFDYFGAKTGAVNSWMDASYARAYNLIYNSWFRDENLIDSLNVNLGDGPDYQGDYQLQKRSKSHDYFTSSLPWPQRGSASQINVGGIAPIIGTSNIYSDDNLFSSFVGSQLCAFRANDASGTYAQIRNVSTGENLGKDYSIGLGADLSTASGITINQLRMSYQFQRLLESMARGGSRYIEIIRSIFGGGSPDARLQRPEFLGMFSSRVNIQAIAQTSATESSSGTAKTPQANLSAMGTVSNSSKPIVKSFVEHGILMFLMNIRSDINYDQGMPRIFNRQTRNDFYWPQYAHLGEQAILNKEIYCQGDNVVDSDGNKVDEKVFGYIPRFDELRFCKNEITGMLRGDYTNSLNYWTLTEHFSNLPALNQEFIEQNSPFARAQAVSSDPVFIVDMYFNSKFARPLPTFGVPGWVDHF